MSKIKLLFCLIVLAASSSIGTTEISDLEMVKPDWNAEWIEDINMKLKWTLQKYIRCQARFNEAIGRLIGLESRARYLKMRNFLEGKINQLLGKRHSINKRRHLRVQKFKNENRLIEKCLRNNLEEIYQIIKRKIINKYHYKLINERIAFMRRIIRHAEIGNSRTMLKEIRNLKILLSKIKKSNGLKSLRLTQFYKDGRIGDRRALTNYIRQLLTARNTSKQSTFKYNKYRNWIEKRLNRSRIRADQNRNIFSRYRQYRNSRHNYMRRYRKSYRNRLHHKINKKYKFRNSSRFANKNKDLGNLMAKLINLNRFYSRQIERKEYQSSKTNNKHRPGNRKESKRSNKKKKARKMYKIRNKLTYFLSDKKKNKSKKYHVKFLNINKIKRERKRYFKKRLQVLHKLKQLNKIYINIIQKHKKMKRNQVKKYIKKIMRNDQKIREIKKNIRKYKLSKIKKSSRNSKLSAHQFLLREGIKKKSSRMRNSKNVTKVKKIRPKQSTIDRNNFKTLMKFLWNHRYQLLRKSTKTNNRQHKRSQKKNNNSIRINNRIGKKNETSKPMRKHHKKHFKRKFGRQISKKSYQNGKKHKGTHKRRNNHKISKPHNKAHVRKSNNLLKNKSKHHNRLLRSQNKSRGKHTSQQDKQNSYKLIKMKNAYRKKEVRNSNSSRYHHKSSNQKRKTENHSPRRKSKQRNKNKSQISRFNKRNHKYKSHERKYYQYKHDKNRTIHRKSTRKHLRTAHHKDTRRQKINWKSQINKTRSNHKLNRKDNLRQLNKNHKKSMKIKHNSDQSKQTIHNTKYQYKHKLKIKNNKIAIKINKKRIEPKKKIIMRKKLQKLHGVDKHVKINKTIKMLNRKKFEVKTKILSIKSRRKSIKSKLKYLKAQKKFMIKNHEKSQYKRQRNKSIIDLHKNSLKMSSTTRRFFEIKIKAIKEQMKSRNDFKSTKDQIISVNKNINKLQNYAKSLNMLVNERLKRGIYLKRKMKLSPSDPIDQVKIKRINKALKSSKSKEKSLTKQMKTVSIRNIVVQKKTGQQIKHQSIESKSKINPIQTKISNKIDNKNLMNKQQIQSQELKMRKSESQSKIINNSRNPSRNKSILTSSIRSNNKIVREKINQSQFVNQPITNRAHNINMKVPNNRRMNERKLSIESQRKIKKIEEKIEKIVNIEYVTREFITQESSIYKKILIN